MQLVRQPLCLSYLMQNVSIMTGLMKKCLYNIGPGWTDSELFHGWLTDHFLKHAVDSRQLLLLLDGHSSHYSAATICFAKEHDVIVLCLLPHTTRVTTSRHVYIRTTKAKLGWCVPQVYATISWPDSDKIPVFYKAWMNSMVSANIVSRFKKCDVYPFNPDAIAYTHQM